MAVQSVLSPLIAGIGGLASNLFNIGEQRHVNRQQMDFSREMWEKQGLREKEFWEMQNAYNDPAAQMKRLSDARLNPNLVYGNGATTQAASLSPKQSHGISPKAGQLDLSSVAQSAMMLRQMNANIARTEAETKAIEARTVNQVFDNEVKTRIGYENYIRSAKLSTERLSTSYQKELSEWEALKIANFDADGHFNATHGYSLSSSSPVVKALKAGLETTVQNAENARALGDIRRFEAIIKNFEANLTKQGISPNSPWFTKIIGDLMEKLLGFGLGDIATDLQKQFK